MTLRHVSTLCGLCALLAACTTDDEAAGGAIGTGDGGSGMFVPQQVGPGVGMTRDDDAGELSASVDASGATDGTCRERTLIEQLDLLFVVDNSNSMIEEQAALQAQFSKLITTLTTGERFPGDPSPFALIKDVHLAVVSTDMGLVGVSGISGCQGFGDDGIMKSPALQGCSGTSAGERFLAYEAGKGDPDELAFNFGCVAMLGTGGCGFEQPLESALKALWPSDDGRVQFLTDISGQGGLGHGDAINQGFLRTDLETSPSMLAVVVVSDEEDCSSFNTSHFRPMAQLDPLDPNYNVGLNLRCLNNAHNLHPVSRYADAFKMLRGGNEDLVMFAAIVGVPPDLVDSAALAKVDFESASARGAFYDGILSDTRMQPREDVSLPATERDLVPSCDTTVGLAYAPVRMVQLAKELGESAVVQSICQDDFGPAIDRILQRLGTQLQSACVDE